jgi:hypothetical protein
VSGKALSQLAVCEFFLINKGLFIKKSQPLHLVPQSQQNPHRTHCPAPPSINNGYYVTDRLSETPLALPAVSLGGEQVRL